MDNLRNAIATKLLSIIPTHVKPIEYLMEILNISRESVYRRLRGEISFTFEEIVMLSVDLGFSIDEIITKEIHSRVYFDMDFTNSLNPSDFFVSTFRHCCYDFDITMGRDTESIMILNHVPPRFNVFFNHLFKFSYYRWMHRNQETSLKYFYSDVVLPAELTALQNKMIENSKKIRNNTLILDSNVFLNLIREVQYYYKRKLIKENEFAALIDDLQGLVSMVEGIAQSGYLFPETKFSLYLSSLNVESCSEYIKCNDEIKSQFYISSVEPVSVINPALCAIHKRWLDSMRKYSTLITQSNELLQVRYFNKQRKYIDDILENPFYSF